MLRRAVSPDRSRLGIKEVLLGLVTVSLIVSLLALHHMEQEREQWRDRLVFTLRSTSEGARASEKRLKQAIKLIREADELGGGGNSDIELQADVATKNGDSVDVLPELVPVSDDAVPDVVGRTTLIVFCFNRADYLERTLKNLASRLETAKKFKEAGLRLIISQDGFHHGVANVAAQFVDQMRTKGFEAAYVQHTHEDFPQKGFLAPYFSLASHYKKGLEYAFNDKSERAIILEDDLEMAIDFFPYFEAFASLLDEDESLLAVSAWNDHGQEAHVKDPKRFYRTDIFPGLGWMMPRRIWEELQPKWPEAFWDDWLRERDQRRGRHTIRPEVSRTITFGRSGASQGQFFDKFLASMRLNSEAVQLTKKNVNDMRKLPFDEWFIDMFNSAIRVSSFNQVPQMNDKDLETEYRLEYIDAQSYSRIAKAMGLMEDFKVDMPRGAYRGILPIRYRGRQVYIAPPVILPLA